MSKWKCEICGNEFENYHAQGFDNKIHCPLCYFKKENKILKENAEHNDKVVDKVNWENMLLKKENKQLKKIIDRASARLEYFLIGNLKYQSSQEEFIKLVNILKEVSK